MDLQSYFIENDHNCSETVLAWANEAYGLGLPAESIKLVSGFGGGLGCGKLCGVLCASIAVLGQVRVKERAHEDPAFKEACAAFTEAFEARFGSCDCALLKPKYRKPDTRCLELIQEGLALLDETVTGEKTVQP